MMIAVVSIVNLGLFVASALPQGLSPYEWYRTELSRYFDIYAGLIDESQILAMKEMSSTVAKFWFATYVIQAAIQVFVVLCLRWVVDRARHKLQWTPFSLVDLPVTCVLPLIASIVVYIVSMLPGVPNADVVYVVAANLFMISVLPLFVQGAAVGKGVMNRSGLTFGWQVALGVMGLIFGALFVVLPLLGLIDFWANFRRLERADQEPLEGNQAD